MSKNNNYGTGIVIGTLDSKDILCNYCGLKFATCPKAEFIKFGNGVGDDNVIECSEFVKKKLLDWRALRGKKKVSKV